jgi:hypothetical protein
MPKKSTFRRKNKRNLKRKTFRKKGGGTYSPTERGLTRQTAMNLNGDFVKNNRVLGLIYGTMQKFGYKSERFIEPHFGVDLSDHTRLGRINYNANTDDYIGQCTKIGDNNFKDGFGRLTINNNYDYGSWSDDNKTGIHLVTPTNMKDCKVEITYWVDDNKIKDAEIPEDIKTKMKRIENKCISGCKEWNN